ncbi:hypothetical protein BIV57_13215 [Mangrovactinospora gilvigrisea]|uniref:TauD/TfdA-like domain-containing protein n=1 Tax=Mangrovactinospora gilvigrisea TaxID=1428644 RepID=A0A1J7BE41_9ACTN|nr:hypothetical protein BIV57_13215 [Mangrovactinospora gilvigrisea]
MIEDHQLARGQHFGAQAVEQLRIHGLVTVPRVRGRSAEMQRRLAGAVLTSLSGLGDPTELVPIDRGDPIGLRSYQAHLPIPPRILVVTHAARTEAPIACRVLDGAALIAHLKRTCPGAANSLARPGSAKFRHLPTTTPCRTVLTYPGPAHYSAIITPMASRRAVFRLEEAARMDLSPAVQGHLAAVEDAICEVQEDVEVMPGQSMIVDNHRWALGPLAKGLAVLAGVQRTLGVGALLPFTPYRPNSLEARR